MYIYLGKYRTMKYLAALFTLFSATNAIMPSYLLQSEAKDRPVPHALVLKNKLEGCWLNHNYVTDQKKACASSILTTIALISLSNVGNINMTNEDKQFFANDGGNFFNHLNNAYGKNATHLFSSRLNNTAYSTTSAESTLFHHYKVSVDGNDHYVSHFLNEENQSNNILYHLNVETKGNLSIETIQLDNAKTVFKGPIISIIDCRPSGISVGYHERPKLPPAPEDKYSDVDAIKPLFRSAIYHELYPQVECRLKQLATNKFNAVQLQYTSSYTYVGGFDFSIFEGTAAPLKCTSTVRDLNEGCLGVGGGSSRKSNTTSSYFIT